MTSEETAAPSTGLHMLALGSSQVCGTDLCDPYCNRIVDSPSGYDPGQDGFTSGVQGLTLTRTAGSVPCTSLTLTPSVASLNVTSLTSPYVSGGNTVTFTLTASPSGCGTASPFTTTWAVDKVDRAAIAGTTNTNGVLTLAVPTAGKLRVTAFAQALSTYVDIPVKLNILNTAPASPNSAATSAQINAFSSAGVALGGTTASTATWLYPYANTYFPLGLTAPVIQYTFSSAPASAQAVKVTLRYPSGKALNDSNIIFNYSMIAKESNAVSAAAGVTANYLDPQIVIPQSVWSAFEQSARGNDADLIVQRYTGTLEYEKAQTIHFVDGQLKGTVYYNSYNSTIGGSTSTNVFGAVLKIKPTDTVPTQAVPYVSSGKNGLQTNGVCTVCHTVSANGSTLTFESGYTNGAGCYGSSASSGNYRGNSCSFSLSSSGTPTWINTFALGGSNQYRFNYGAPYPDGSFYLTNAWDNTESFGSSSALAQVSTGNTLASTGTPPLAITPAFSSDGRTVAYNDGTDGLVVIAEIGPCRSSSGAASPKEFAVIRNDSPATVDISGWTIKRSTGATCFTVGSSVTLTAGAISTLDRTTDCMADAGDTLKLYDSDGNLRYTAPAYSISGTCGSASGKYGTKLSCAETWSNKSSTSLESAACTITSDGDMTRNTLKAKSFSCGAASGSTTCGSGAKTFSSERTVADCGSTGCVTAGNPSFLPDGRGLVYQHVTTAPATSATNGGG
ncbi:MAG TPA: lamin tail domain-containing protein, partial [Polyangiaceae bacterium]|nr:lamin tail domain-containing protein [Polyangiaceae bacterium]